MKKLYSLAAASLIFLPMLVSGKTLEQVVSLEDPRFRNTHQHVDLSAGEDGRVYLTSVHVQGSLTLSMNPDGSDRKQFDISKMGNDATANADGVIAASAHHYIHSVFTYTPEGETIGRNANFLIGENEPYKYAAPEQVVAGPSGDFYANDLNRSRILRLDANARLVDAYPIQTGFGREFDVSEPTERFALKKQRHREVVLVKFDGTEITRIPTDPFALFALTREGMLYTLAPKSREAVGYDDGGQEISRITLDADDVPPTEWAVDEIDIQGNRLFVRRKDPSELFRVYDLSNGKLLHTVRMKQRRLTVDVPEGSWTAGSRIPALLNLQRETDFPTSPRFRFWMAPLGTGLWQELDWNGKELTVPEDLAGICQLRVSEALRPADTSTYRIDELIEVRAPDSRGNISVWTPFNRMHWARGVDLPLAFLFRSSSLKETEAEIELMDLNGKVLSLWSGTLIQGRGQNITLTATQTAHLMPGLYAVVPKAAGLTCVPQWIHFGPRTGAPPTFRNVMYGDYANSNNPRVSGYDFADTAFFMLDRAQGLGFNQFVNRIHAGRYPLAFFNGADAGQLFKRLEKRLASDPNATPPQKAEFGFPPLHYAGAYGGHGIREMVLPIDMDSSIKPDGNRGARNHLRTVKKYSEAFEGVKGFYGWTWAANWWLHRPERILNEEKAAYNAGMKKARETGEWSPILEQVGLRNIQYQIDSQEMLAAAMNGEDPTLTTAAGGPYRRPDMYPPLNFSNVDEIDLHFQMEQISAPLWTAHAPQFYRIPGKPGWLHPELGAENGTGEYTESLGWLGLMRGANGYGSSGPFKDIIPPETDSRAGYYGVASMFRALNERLSRYGEWFNQLENRDRIGIVVSKRECLIDDWGKVIGGKYFGRIYEAYLTLLHAGYPATLLYSETATAEDLDRLDAVLIVAQTVDPEPAMIALVNRAEQSGATVMRDEETRTNYFPSAQTLPVTFNEMRNAKVHIGNSDDAFWVVPEVCHEQAERILPFLRDVSSPVLNHRSHRDVLLSERGAGEIRTYWMVNNALPSLKPELLWAVSLGISSRAPADYDIDIPLASGEALYDIFAQRLLRHHKPAGFLGNLIGGGGADEGPAIETVSGVLRGGGGRVLAVLPQPVESVIVDLQASPALGTSLNYNIQVPGIGGPLPIHLQLLEADGRVIEERYTVTGPGTIPIPTRAKEPIQLVATELISGIRSDEKDASLSPRFAPHPEASRQSAATLEGPRLRHVAITPDGRSAWINAFNWGNNLYRLNLDNGAVETTGTVGQYHSFAPVATERGLFVQGYDFLTAQGYHSYLLQPDATAQRRFALPGIPARMKPWHFPSAMIYPVNQHAAAPKGTWLAGSGNLGLAVWTTDGTLLWKQDWFETERKRVQLHALNEDTLLVGDGMTLSAYPVSGEVLTTPPNPRWSITLPGQGQINRIFTSADGTTIGVGNHDQNAQIFLLSQDGKLKTRLYISPISASLSPDGSRVAVSSRHQTNLYAGDGDQLWSFGEPLYSLAFSPNGSVLAGSTLDGWVHRFDLAGAQQPTAVESLDFGTTATLSWLPDGDLLLTGWLGKVARYAPDGSVRWIQDFSDVELSPYATIKGRPVPDDTPTVRLDHWKNNTEQTLSLDENLLHPRTSINHLSLGKGPTENGREFLAQIIGRQWVDRQTTPPKDGWLSRYDVGMIDSGWKGKLAIYTDFHRLRARVEAVMIVEDPDHPESWIRDARLEYKDEETGEWKLAGYLMADAPIHTHKLAQPVTARIFRITAADRKIWPGEGWKPGNIRFSELVFQGEMMGAAHPDIANQSPVAVLFDGGKNDMPGIFNGRLGGQRAEGNAYHGAAYLRSVKDREIYGEKYPVFGRSFPGWDFKIAETPAPGKYRYLQFAVKKDGKPNGEPAEATLCLAPEYGKSPNIWLRTGRNDELRRRSGQADVDLLDAVPEDWTVVRVDLWKILTEAEIDPETFRLRDISFWVKGGPVGFDQILLGRSEADLDAHHIAGE